MSGQTGTQTPCLLRNLLTAQRGMPLLTDDLLALVLPLFDEVAGLHAQGRVANLDAACVSVGNSGGLVLNSPDGQAVEMNIGEVRRIQPSPGAGLNVVGNLQREHDGESGERQERDLAVQDDAGVDIATPVFLPGPQSWEKRLGHHDEITDVFLLGMLLAELACGLDFSDIGDLRSFVQHRKNLFVLNEGLNPVIAAVIVQMTELNRRARATDVAGLATRLRTWRELPQGMEVEQVLAGQQDAMPRRTAVLTHLRDRLFDISRRNRLLYFRPGSGAVNFTVASVPLVLQVESIRADQICTWGGTFASGVLSGKDVQLQRWLRFEDQPYLSASLDSLLTQARRDRAEFGFSNLRLVAAFLRWHNLKDAPEERIVSPLLWVPVELSRRKGVRDQYVLRAEGAEAEVNPVLRHHLQQLYGIRLPETVDLAHTSIEALHADILAQIRRTEPAVELRLVERASIRIVRQKALQRMQQYQRRRAPQRIRMLDEGWLPSFSYDAADYRPLGRALYEAWVCPSVLPQRFEAGAPVAARQPRMSGASAQPEDADRDGYVLQESEGHRYAWDLDLTQVTLANFNYRKMSLVRDYAQLLESPAANAAFDRVFSIEPRQPDKDMPLPLPLDEQWNVVSADATQNAAVGLARTGACFIIQGPPGTGKSQTITNLIADYAARGKRVLFVCEKRAALDVVYHRLRQSGLDALCCLIHDSQTDKRAFVADLKSCYETWMAAGHACDTLQAERQQRVGALVAHQSKLGAFDAAFGDNHESLGGCVRALLRRIVMLPEAPDTGAAKRELLPALAVWDGQRELIGRLQRFVQERLGAQSLAEHPFAVLTTSLVQDPHAFGVTEQMCRQAEHCLDELNPVLDLAGSPLNAATPLEAAAGMAEDAQWLVETGLVRQLDLLDVQSETRRRLQEAVQRLTECQSILASARKSTEFWRDRLSLPDTQAALALARRLEPSLLRWLQPAWWKLRSQLRQRYDFARHAVAPAYVTVLEALDAEHAAVAACEMAEVAGQVQFAVPDLAAFRDAHARLEERLPADVSLQNVVNWVRQSDDAPARAALLAGIRGGLRNLCEQVRGRLEQGVQMTPGQLDTLLRDLLEALEDLPDALPLLRALHAGDTACCHTLRQIAALPASLDALVADEALQRLVREYPVLHKFGGAALSRSAAALAQGQRDLYRINARLLAAIQHRQFSDHVRISMQSATQLDNDAKQFKKLYATGRRELEHEFGKSMRFRSIRDLCDAESGMVINDLKPIWLMSPLSVSDTLPLSDDLFDVVIFDEASQIPSEEAVPALSRAQQIIVVGDEMQLPPTSFFTAGGEADEDEIVVEEEGERIAINLDADSLLNQAARNLPATLLAWHYRSRHEALISFSNAAFYDGRLVTIPDRMIEVAGDESATVRADATDAGIVAADALLGRPLSFHLLADGVYESRRNRPEAAYIAQTVRELLMRQTGLSLGIVAFSEAQQAAIEEALEALATEVPEFAVRLEQEYVREDDGQFNGLFVKNLENVQGDERDVIILSICYGPGPDGRMLMNFGPINQRGGEKRLNVIFSRARRHMAVVSTIRAEAITNVHNDGAAALRGFLQFAQASAAGHFERAQSVLGALNEGARQAFTRTVPEDSVRDALAEALRSRGHEVHVTVGRSLFRCDLAVVAADRCAYALGLMLDAPRGRAGDPIERYVFRPEVLRGFGWRILDIPAHDWIADAQGVLARIEAVLAGGEDPALDGLPVRAGETTVPQKAPVASAGPQEAQAPDPAGEPDHVRSLRVVQGSAGKFWRVSVHGCALLICYGRIGSTGQKLWKHFDSPQRARADADRMAGEKLSRGYSEDILPQA